jgi:hypothetical protein
MDPNLVSCTHCGRTLTHDEIWLDMLRMKTPEGRPVAHAYCEDCGKRILQRISLSRIERWKLWWVSWRKP